MPTSHMLQLNEIAYLTYIINPTTLLDIGIGTGKYGMLAKEFVEQWDENRRLAVVGVEAFRDYVRTYHYSFYDKIIFGDVINNLTNNLLTDIKYDLTYLIDVFEHFSLDRAICLLDALLKISDVIIISTPKDIGDQIDTKNPFENHVTQWNPKLLKQSLDADISFFVVDNLISWIFVISIQKTTLNTIKKFYTKMNRKIFWSKIFPFIKFKFKDYDNRLISPFTKIHRVGTTFEEVLDSIH